MQKKKNNGISYSTAKNITSSWIENTQILPFSNDSFELCTTLRNQRTKRKTERNKFSYVSKNIIFMWAPLCL